MCLHESIDGSNIHYCTHISILATMRITVGVVLINGPLQEQTALLFCTNILRLRSGSSTPTSYCEVSPCSYGRAPDSGLQYPCSYTAGISFSQ